MSRDRWVDVLVVIGLLAVNAAVKFSLWAQPPQTFPDSNGYLAPAMRLLDGLGYGTQENGFRTPTYPLFIAAILLPSDHSELSKCRGAREPACLGEAQHTPSGEADLRAIVDVQVVLGALVLVLVYAFAYHITHTRWLAALCALTYAVDLSTGYWEISILTDALTTFLVMLSVWLTVVTGTVARFRLAWALALGAALGALALCHSDFLLYAIVPAAFLLARVGQRAQVLPVLLVPAVMVLAWSGRNYAADGYFTPTTITGYNLTQMVGSFMERAPAPYRDLADIYLQYRAQRIAVRGNHSGTIFFAYRDMLAERGTTWAGLSRVLTAMSLEMIVQNPIGYLQVAWESFLQFWKIGLGKQNAEVPLSYDWVKWFLDSRIQQAMMILFFLAPFGLLLLQRSRGSDGSTTFWIWFAMATVWYAALFSSAFNFGDNERYRTHVARLQYTVVLATAWLVAQRYVFSRTRSAGSLQQAEDLTQ